MRPHFHSSVQTIMKAYVLIAFGLALVGTCRSAVMGYSGERPSPFDSGVERGMNRTTALSLIGEPHVMLGNDVWMLFGARMENQGPTVEGEVCVIYFQAGRVSIMKIIPLAVARRMIAMTKLPVITRSLPPQLRGSR